MSSNFSIAVLISGGGTTLRNLIEKRRAGELLAEIGLVVSSNPDAAGLAYAREHGIPDKTFSHREYPAAKEISEPIFRACREHEIDLVVLGGFLRRILIPSDFEGRVINIHPSLIPAYCGKGMYGMSVHRAVIENQAAVTGCTVHFVDNEYDHGPVIAQSSVLVGDHTAESLQAAVFARECQLYPAVINAMASGQVRLVGDEVIVAANADLELPG